MKYSGMARFMWPIYRRSFASALTSVLGYNRRSADRIMRCAMDRYQSIISKLPEFEKDDIFKNNILSCSMLIAVLQSLDKRPALQDITEYYKQAMTNAATKVFCSMAAKQKFNDRDIKKMKETAALHSADHNPYSWNMDYIPYEDGSGYEARFYKCGICTLMKEYGYFDLVPAMCALDYTMSDMGGATVFVREHTLASGGPYCDCGYKKKDRSMNIWDRFAPVYRGFVTGTPGNRKAYETMYRKIRAVVKDNVYQ